MCNDCIGDTLAKKHDQLGIFQIIFKIHSSPTINTDRASCVLCRPFYFSLGSWTVSPDLPSSEASSGSSITSGTAPAAASASSLGKTSTKVFGCRGHVCPEA